MSPICGFAFLFLMWFCVSFFEEYIMLLSFGIVMDFSEWVWSDCTLSRISNNDMCLKGQYLHDEQGMESEC